MDMDVQDDKAKARLEIRSWMSASFLWTRPGRSLLSQRPLPPGASVDVTEFQRLRFLHPPWCRICAFPFELDEGQDQVCAACLAEPPVFSSVRSALEYSDQSSALILRLKRQGIRNGLTLYGRWMYDVAREQINTADMLIPVPLHYRRLVSRGFNQAGWLATAIARHAGIPVRYDLLKRTKASQSQGRLSARQRRLNVSGAFEVPEKQKARIRGRRIVLVDDVFTTGSTVSACAKALLRSGAANVDVVTLARVVAPRKPTI